MLFGLLPVPIFIGEVLSIFSLLSSGFGLGSLYSLVGRCPFDNKFLIIQKKKKPLRSKLFLCNSFYKIKKNVQISTSLFC